MFIVQFEGFLPTNEEIYRYNFDNAMKIGDHKFRQNTYAYSNSESIAANPKGEAALTYQFFKDKGYFMMSRFVTLADETRKNEL